MSCQGVCAAGENNHIIGRTGGNSSILFASLWKFTIDTFRLENKISNRKVRKSCCMKIFGKMGSCLKANEPEPFLFIIILIFKEGTVENFWHIVLQPLSHCTYTLLYICSHTPICIHLSTTAAFYFTAATNFCH